MTTHTSPETLTGYTTRPVTFTVTHPVTRRALDIRQFPAGTEVVCKEHRSGDSLIAHIPGTAFSQRLYFSAVRPA